MTDKEYSLKNQDQVLDLPFIDPYPEETDDLERYDWLNKEFNRRPFQLYRCWLVLSIGIAVGVECFFLRDMYALFKLFKTSWSTQAKEIAISQSLININHVLLLFGCGQMLFGMMKKKAISAQKAVLKLQIALISSVCYLVIQIILKGFGFNLSLIGTLKVFVVPIIAAVNLIAGLAVLKAFKKNHPLARQEPLPDISRDFLQQNEAIAAEILKYDQQLDSWPYLIYKIWLGLCFVLNLFLFWTVSTMLVKISQTGARDLEISIFCLYFGFLNVVCSYEMFVALRRRLLDRSKRAIFLLKIFISVTIIILVIWEFPKEGLFDSLIYLVCCISVPLMTLIGALRVRNILEQRENFVKISSYNSGESYL